jgi:hypothetical protein
MPVSSVSVVPIGPKKCKPFLLEVMVFSPESGYKFKVLVERSCTPDADELWKLVFDLYKVDGSKETQLVHVSYKSQTPVEAKAVQRMASQGVKPEQAAVLTGETYHATKAVAGKKKVSQAEKERINTSVSHVLNISN